MRKKIFRRFLTRLFLGCFCFSLLPWLAEYQKNKYEKNEFFFSSPLITESKTLSFRRDQNGKGYFGASRNGGRIHQGIDLAVPVENPVLAAKSGRVVFAGEEKGYGNTIDILHPDGLLSRYAHLSAFNIVEGEWVTQNQMIGRSGKTGNAANPKIMPHLHFEIRYRGQALDPTNHLLDPSITLHS